MPSAFAAACTQAPGHLQYELEYYNAVTSVYVAVAEDFRPEDKRYPSDNFTVSLRPVEAVWGGPVPSEPIKLEFTAGACVDWVLWENEDSESLDGKRFFVFDAPQSKESAEFLPVNSRLHVVSAGDRPAASALIMLGRLQVSGGVPSWQEPPAPPEEMPSAATAFWEREHSWPWVAGAAGILFILGLIIGRVTRPRRDKEREKP